MTQPVPLPDRPPSLLREGPSLVHTRNGRLLVLTLATVTMVVETASMIAGITIPIGDIGVSVSVVPALLLLFFLGVPTVGRAGDRDRLVPFWIAMAAGLAMGAVLFARTGDIADLGALLLAATDEEVVYRFAVPVVLTTALMVLRTPARAARVAGYVVAGGVWIFLPGHQAQMTSLATVGTYLAFAVISAVVVARSRALIPMSVAHCVLNVITIAAFRGDITEGSRSLLSGCLLFLLVGTFAWPGDRRRHATEALEAAVDPGDFVDDTVIDLRDGERPSVTRDGVVSYVDEAVVDISDDHLDEHAEVGPGR